MPPVSRSFPSSAAARRSALCLCALLVVGAALLGYTILRPGSSQADAQAATSTTAGSSTISTTRDVLQGRPSPAARSTTTTSGSTKDTSNQITHSINYKVWAIVGGLVLIAIVLSLLTWGYWRRTRPGSAAAAGTVEEPARADREREPVAAPSNRPAVRREERELDHERQPAPQRDRERQGEPARPTALFDQAAEEEPEEEVAAQAEPAEPAEHGEHAGPAEPAEHAGHAESPESGGGLRSARRKRSTRYSDLVITVPHPEEQEPESDR